MKVPIGAEKILRTLNTAGYDAYIVGGCVRDGLLGRVPQDWDITTAAEPTVVKNLFTKTYDTGIQHGTVTVVLGKEHFEVTTYRIESEYEDCRHPNHVFFTKSLQEDLRRRDFTINAMAYHMEEGIQDFFHGQEDLQKGILRGVGNPRERFQEDALRMLRGLRFATQLGFMIEPETYEALQIEKKRIQKISAERIHEELEKMLQAQYLERMVLLWESGLLAEIIPPLAEQMKSMGKQVIAQLQKAPKDRVLRWTIFLQGMTAKEGEDITKQLKFDTATSRAVVTLLEHLKEEIPCVPYILRKKANQIGVERLQQLLLLQDIIYSKGEEIQNCFAEILQRGDGITVKELAIDGKDLMALGIPKGKQMGLCLNVLLDIVHQDPAKNTKKTLLSLAEEKKGDW